MIAPAWMRELVTAGQYGAWTPEQRAGIEIVDGMVLVGPSPVERHNRMARLLANAVDAAGGPDWNADTGGDVQLQDVPLNNRCTDVTVYRADSIDVTPTRPEQVLLIVEVVSPGSETTDRVVKPTAPTPARTPAAADQRGAATSPATRPTSFRICRLQDGPNETVSVVRRPAHRLQPAEVQPRHPSIGSVSRGRFAVPL